MNGPGRSPEASEQGAALLLALLSAIVITAVAGALIVLTNTESAIAGNHRVGVETLYAADAALTRALAELATAPAWTDVLGGGVRSTWFDASPSPVTRWNESIDLQAMTTAWQSESAAGPFGANNPIWRLFASGDVGDMIGVADSGCAAYAAVWVSDDPADVDNNPLADSNGVLVVRAAAIGPGGVRRVVQASIQREAGATRTLTWREWR